MNALTEFAITGASLEVGLRRIQSVEELSPQQRDGLRNYLVSLRRQLDETLNHIAPRPASDPKAPDMMLSPDVEIHK